MTPKNPSNEEILEELITSTEFEDKPFSTLNNHDYIPKYYAELLVRKAMAQARQAGYAEGAEEQKEKDIQIARHANCTVPNCDSPICFNIYDQAIRTQGGKNEKG